MDSTPRPTRNRIPSVFFFRTTWYCKIDGKRVYVCEGSDSEKAAWRQGKRAKQIKPNGVVTQALLEMLTLDSTPETKASTRIDTLAELYLEHERVVVAESSFETISSIVEDFARFAGAVTLAELTPAHITRWLGSHEPPKNPKNKRFRGWQSNSTKHRAIKTIKAMVNFAIAELLIEKSPIKTVKPPKHVKRGHVITPEEEALVNQIARSAFAEFFEACIKTGQRPGEIARLTADMVHDTGKGLVWRVDHKNVGKTGDFKTVYLCDEMQVITQKQLMTHPDGLLFRRANGKAWHKKSWVQAMGYLRNRCKKQTGVELPFSLYDCRHTFITRKLLEGHSIEVVAELVGNSPTILYKHYSHLSSQADVLMDAMKKGPRQGRTVG